MRVHRGTALVLAATTALLGVAILAVGIAEGGSAGIVIGLLFVGAGAGRLYLMRRRR